MAGLLLRDRIHGVLWVVVLLSVLQPGVAAASDGLIERIDIDPGSTSFDNPTVSVEIEWEDPNGLDRSTMRITLNGDTVTGDFTHSTGTTLVFSTGTITLQSGTNTLIATISDSDGDALRPAKAIYTYDVTAPTVQITPGNNSYFRTAIPTAAIVWEDDTALQESSMVIRIGADTITTNFGYGGVADSARSVGTVPLSTDIQMLWATICDEAGNCGSKSASYLYDPDAPTVSISPASGTGNNASRIVDIAWGDGMALDSARRVITLNGDTVTGDFDYGGTLTSATSTGTLTLREGSNSLVAKIYDKAGNVATASGSYVYDSTPPLIEIDPLSGTYTLPTTLPVTVDWEDARGLDPASDTIWFNDANITGSFDYTTTSSTTATSTFSNPGITLEPGTNRLEAKICDGVGNCDSLSTIYHYNADTTKPTLESVEPDDGSYFRTEPITLELTWSDDRGLEVDSLEVKVGTSDVSTGFSCVGGSTSKTCTGPVPLDPGPQTVTARICDTSNNCALPEQFTYHYDNTAPAVDSIRPGSGTFNNSSPTVTVYWSDNLALDSTSQAITLNGDTVTSDFPFSGMGALGSSTGPVELALGSNTLSARICDKAGNCSAIQSASYELLPVYSVAVTTSQSPVSAAPYAEGLEQTFTVENTGNIDVTYLLRAECAEAVTGCSVPPHQLELPLAAGESAAVSVSFNVGAPGSTGTLELVAEQSDRPDEVQDAATVSVTVAAEAGAIEVAPEVSVAEENPGTTLERGLCLTLSMGSAAASECGDLRIVHPLPTTRTLGKARTPVLLYNSQHAHPYPLVRATVTLPEDGKSPDRVEAVLEVAGLERASEEWPGNHWQFVGDARRIALGFDASALATGIYPYTLEVTNWYGTTTAKTTTVSDTLVIVNRSGSPFGAGWWLAGLEEFDPATGLWIGGDGSARKYAAVNDSVWVAASLDRPDTLTRNGSTYVRHLPGGVRVVFNGAGQHIRTVNRLGHETTFQYASGRLSTITLPVPAGAPARVYDFAYDASNKLDRVTAPSVTTLTGVESRVADVTITYDRIISILDPGDTLAVGFVYDAEQRLLIRMRRGRRGNFTEFRFDDAHQLAKSMFYLEGFSWDPLPESLIVRNIRNVAAQSLSPNVTDARGGYTLYDGPRPLTDVGDTTAFYLDGFGAPWKITDALGNATVLERTDLDYPALVTRVQYPNGRILGASYDGRGNVLTVTDSSTYRVEADGTRTYATTRYEYKDTHWPDFVSRIVPPEGDSVMFHYDPQTGNRDWQEDARGVSSRVSYVYDPATGLLTDIQLPAVEGETGPAVEHVAYDTYGNLSLVRSPIGFETTYLKDNIGRDTAIVSPIDGRPGEGIPTTLHQRQSLTYWPGKDWVHTATTYGPAMNGADAQWIHVERGYDTEGHLTSLSRWSEPDSAGVGTITTYWEYDPAGRMVKEIAPDTTPAILTDNPSDSTVYDKAGNPVRLLTRRLDPATGTRLEITLEYDALNRLITRIVPQVHYPARNEGIPWAQNPVGPTCSTSFYTYKRTYPSHPNDGSCGYLIPADTATFAYDEMGSVIRANNRDARISRTYYPNGALRTDTLKIRTTTDTLFDQHMYVLQNSYDLNGRRVQVTHPPQLAGGTLGTTRWSYDPQLGALETVTDARGNLFTLSYDARGRDTAVAMPGGVTEHYGYDPDGRRTRHQVSHAAGYLRDAALGYDARGKMLHVFNTVGAADTLYAEYSGLGQVVSHSMLAYGWDPFGNNAVYIADETFEYDALGNQTDATTTESHRIWNGSGWDYSGSNSIDHTYTYLPGVGRQISVGRIDAASGETQKDTLIYDAAGNQVWLTAGGAEGSDRATYFSADGRVAAADFRSLTESSWQSAFEEYRYDALGRRVWVRARRDCGGIDPLCKLDKIRRIVWDGEQELYEIQMPGEDGSAYLENDTAPVELAAIFDNESTGLWYDPNVYYGRVAYTRGLAIDRPLSVIRFGYRSVMDQQGQVRTPLDWSPFALLPLWSPKGQADLGTFEDGQLDRCTVFENVTRCVWRDWLAQVHAYHRSRVRRNVWHGSLLEDKQDAAGTLYRRNRYYDPATGRFTQEDPIGLAGGLNLYGFAAGDPVNFSDPFGLKTCEEDESLWDCLKSFLAYEWRGFQAGADPTRTSINREEEGSFGALLGRLSLVLPTARFGAVGSGAGSASARPWYAPATHETRVTRWMSEAESTAMRNSGTLQVGAEGRTYVTSVGAPKPGGTGPVRVDFNVPTGALSKAGQGDWYQIFSGGRNIPITGITWVQ